MSQETVPQETLKLRNIHYTQNGSSILSNINLDLASGETLAVIGHNGAGKSILAAIITGYQWPSTGTISVLGETFGEVNLSDLRKHIRLISTSRTPNFPVNMRVRDVVATGHFGTIVIPMYTEISKLQHQKVEEELQFVEMLRHADRFFNQLSTGEKTRILIARALVSAPKLLVFDEPCSGLDIKAKALMIKTMDQMRARQNRPSLVIISHHLDELPTHLDQVLLMKKGQAFAYGSPKDVITEENFSNALECNVTIVTHKNRYLSCIAEIND